MKQKIYSSLDAAVAGVPDGAVLCLEFGGAGFPNYSIQALARGEREKLRPSAIIAGRMKASWD